MPALDVREPGHLLAKLEYECQALLADNSNSYAAINALRDAYHLSEWIWASRLKGDPGLQVTMMGAAGGARAWFAWVKQQFPNLPVIEELCSGSKHFRPGCLIRANHRAGWDSPISFWDNPNSGWDDTNHLRGT